MNNLKYIPRPQASTECSKNFPSNYFIDNWDPVTIDWKHKETPFSDIFKCVLIPSCFKFNFAEKPSETTANCWAPIPSQRHIVSQFFLQIYKKMANNHYKLVMLTFLSSIIWLRSIGQLSLKKSVLEEQETTIGAC